MRTVYLCGPIEDVPREEAIFGWRKKVAEGLDTVPNVKCVSPMRGGLYFGADHPVSNQIKAIVNRDRYDCTNANLVFCNFLNAKKISQGSLIELGIAYSANVPIMLVTDKKNPNNSIFLTEICPYILYDLDEAIKMTQDLLSYGLR